MKQIFWWPLWLVSLLLPLPAQSQAHKPEKVTHMFWHIVPLEGTTPEQAAALEKTVRLHFATQRGKALMDNLAMDSVLLIEGNEKFLRCGTGAACLAGLGQSAGVGWVITGELALTLNTEAAGPAAPVRTDHAAPKSRLTLALVEVAKKASVSRAQVEFAGAIDKPTLDELTIAMFEPARYRGSLEIECAEDGAEVFLDGIRSGVTPLIGPLANLPAGLHRLEVKKSGFKPFEREVAVRLGEIKHVVALLPRLAAATPTAHFAKSWIFWSLATTGVVALTSGIVLQVNASTWSDNASIYKQKRSIRWVEEQDKADQAQLGATLALGIGGALVVAAVSYAVVNTIERGDEKEVRNASERASLTWQPLAGGGLVSIGWTF